MMLLVLLAGLALFIMWGLGLLAFIVMLVRECVPTLRPYFISPKFLPKIRSAGFLGLFVAIFCAIAGFVWGFLSFKPL